MHLRFRPDQGNAPRPGRARRAAEIAVLRGPGGRFFSDGSTLLSASHHDLSLWDPATGTRTGCIAGFTPAYYHPAARELLEVSGSELRRARHS